MKRLLAIPVSLMLALVVGCAALGLPTADTFNQKLIAGYSTVSAIRTSNVMLLDAKKISAADGENIHNSNEAARAGLDTAAVIARTDMTAADAKLNAVRTALTALSAYLATRSK